MTTKAAQTIRKLNQDGSVSLLSLPGPRASVIGSVKWGRYDVLFTPAFWVTRLWIDNDLCAADEWTR